MPTKHPHRHVDGDYFKLATVSSKYNSLVDTRPAVLHLHKSYHYSEPKLGYVVPMDRKPNRGLKRESTLLMQHLNFLDEAHLQQGYAYYVYPDFPRKLLNIVSVLQKANLINGYDVDENGFVNYCDDEEE